MTVQDDFEPDWRSLALVVRHAVVRRVAASQVDDVVAEVMLGLVEAAARGAHVEEWEDYAVGVARRVVARVHRVAARICVRACDPGELEEFASGIEMESEDPRVRNWFRGEFLPRLLAELTGRQQLVLQVLLSAGTLKGAARELKRDPRTVRSIRRRIIERAIRLAEEAPPRATSWVVERN